MSQTIPLARNAEAKAFMPPNLQLFSEGFQNLSKCWVDIMAQQVELTSKMIRGAVADTALLTEARSPDALWRAEVEIYRRGTERMLEASAAVISGIQDVIVHSVDVAMPSLGAKAA